MNDHDFSRHIQEWKVSMSHGLMDNGRPYSEDTVKIYISYVEKFLDTFHVLNRKTLRAQLSSIPPEMFGKRDKIYKALICFAKHLVDEGAMDEGFIQEVAKLRPKRHIPAKQTVLDEEDMDKLLDGCRTFKERAALILCASTGMRASEVCNLKWSDLDLKKAVLKVKKAKWGKTRNLGLTNFCIEALENVRSKSPDYVLGGMTRFGLYRLIRRVGARSGVVAHPHALRVAFVTINHKKGRPLQALQVACGHSKITTTAGYCKIKEDEVVDMMKTWA